MGEPAFLCPACHTPLPAAGAAGGQEAIVSCVACAAEVDLARAGTAAGRPRFVPEADRTGEVVGGYFLLGRLGAGGMGTIYRARRLAEGENDLGSARARREGALEASASAKASARSNATASASADVGASPSVEASASAQANANASANPSPHAELDARADVTVTHLQPEVALKMMGAGLAHDPPAVSRFLREIALLRDLDHPHIVRVLDAGMYLGVPWFAMELVAGEDLRKRLTRGPLEPPEARALVRELFAALAAAHAHGIVHRDLKPANVLLSPRGIKLADFGVAAPDDARRDLQTQLTESAAVLGTLPYMSPEQRAGRRVDARSDLFSAGVLLYEAITGQLPMGAFPPASQLNPTFPSAVDPLIMALLHPDPAHRPADAHGAGARWEKALAPRPSRVRPLAAALVGVLTLGATGLVVRRGQLAELASKAPIAATAHRSFAESRGPVLPAAPSFNVATTPAQVKNPFEGDNTSSSSSLSSSSKRKASSPVPRARVSKLSTNTSKLSTNTSKLSTKKSAASGETFPASDLLPWPRKD